MRGLRSTWTRHLASEPTRWSSAEPYRQDGAKPKMAAGPQGYVDIAQAAFSDDGAMVAVRSGGNLEVWDTATARLLNSFTVSDGTTAGPGEKGPLRFVQGGRGLLAVGFAHAAVFDVRTGALVKDVRGLTDASGGSRVMVASGVTTKLLDAERGTVLTLPIDRDLAISADGSRVAGTKTNMGGPHGAVVVFDGATGEKVAEIKPPSEPLGVALSADGARIAIGSVTLGATDLRGGERHGRRSRPQVS